MSKLLKVLNRKLRKDNKGFTLVELLVVIAIIGVLAAVAVPSLFKNIEKGKVAALQTDINAIKTQMLSDYTETSTIPSDVDADSLADPFKGTVTYGVDGDGDLLVLGISTSIKDEEVVTKLMNEMNAVAGTTTGTTVIKVLGDGTETAKKNN